MPPQRVLLVDDEEELLKAMKIRLVSWGYDVITATGGKEALDLIKRGVADVVILDIVMPRMDGIQTLRRIREFDKKLPVIMLTAYGDEERFKETRQLGISGFIRKGVRFENVSELLRITLKGQKYEVKAAKRKVLVVDDEKELVEAIRIRLQAKGYEVVLAYDGEEALPKAQEGPDLILLDVLMPKKDGFDVLLKLRENAQTRDIPVIMLTVRAETAAIVKAQDLGSTDYIVKPFEIEELLDLIERYISLSAEGRLWPQKRG